MTNANVIFPTECESLTSAAIPDSVTTIGKNVFDDDLVITYMGRTYNTRYFGGTV